MAEMFTLGFEIDTQPLAKAGQEAQKAADAVSKLGDAERKMAQDAKVAKDALDQQAQSAQKAGQAAGQHGSGMSQGAQSAKQFEDSMKSVTGTLKVQFAELEALMLLMKGGGGGGFVGAIGGAAGALGNFVRSLGPVGIGFAALAVGVGAAKLAFDQVIIPLAKAQDQMAMLEARFKNALGSTYAAKSAMSDLFDQTQKTGLGFNSAADAFARLARNNEAIGATRSQLLQMTDVLQKLGAVSGASSGEIASGMLQLGQALASGRLQGDELRSILENFPALAKAIAESLGVTIGQLRAMGSTGELTGDKIMTAILRATDKANKEFANLPDTVERANMRIADSWDKLFAEVGKRFNASSFATSVLNLANKLLQMATPTETTGGQRIAELQARRDRFAKLPGIDAQRNVASIDAQIAAIRAQGEKSLAETRQSNEMEEQNAARAPILRSQAIAKEVDDFNEGLKKAKQNYDQIQDAVDRINIRMKSGLAQDDEKAMLPTLSRAAKVAKAELEQMVDAIQNVQRGLSDTQRAFNATGGGGGMGLYMQAISADRAAQKQGRGGLGAALSALINQEVTKSQDTITTLNQQTDAQTRLNFVIGENVDLVREMEVKNEVLQKRFAMFGNLQSPVIDRFFDRYTQALKDNKKAVQEAADANQVLQSKIGMGNAQALLGASPTATAQAYQHLLNDIANQRKNFGSQDAFDEYRANRLGEYGLTQQNTQRMGNFDLNMQIESIRRQRDALGKSTDEYRVQQAIIAKQIDLERQGYEQGGAYYDQQVRLTEQLERQTILYEKQRDKTQGIIKMFEDTADSLKGTFTSAIMESFDKGIGYGYKVFGQGMVSMIKKLGAEMIYEISYRPFVEMARNMASMLGSKFTQMLGLNPGGLGGGGGGGGFMDAGSVPLPGTLAAAGMGFGSGGIRMFAGGGAFTNSIVNSPTLFRFAGGGALGMMGEAGPEAILPLTRGADGKLGVAGGGGGVQVVINDMRSGNSAPVETKSQRGPNGQQIISVMVRDEVRKQIRNGDLDRDMNASYGASRLISRR